MCIAEGSAIGHYKGDRFSSTFSSVPLTSEFFNLFGDPTSRPHASISSFSRLLCMFIERTYFIRQRHVTSFPSSSKSTPVPFGYSSLMQVQVVGTLCTTPDKDARQEILRRCAGGGGTFKTVGGGDIVLPEANLNEIANQADDIVTVSIVKLIVENVFSYLFSI